MQNQNGKIKIRKAQPKDYSTICSLLNNELEYPSIKLNELTSRITMMNQEKNYYTFVALDYDNVVGFIGLMQNIMYEYNGLCMRILAIAVSNDYQNKKIGSNLLEYASHFAVTKGIDLFMVNSGEERIEAHRFYEHNGFVKSSYGFWKLL